MKVLVISLLLFLTVAVSAQTNVIVTAAEANLRAAPSAKSKIITTISSGELLKVIGKAGVWRKVQTENGIGWLHGSTVAAVGTVLYGDTYIPPPKAPVAPKLLNWPPPRIEPSKTYFRGPRGGCYYINPNGNKTYVNRSFCN